MTFMELVDVIFNHTENWQGFNAVYVRAELEAKSLKELEEIYKRYTEGE